MKKINHLKKYLLKKNLLDNNSATKNQFIIKDGIVEPFSVDDLGFQYHFTLSINLTGYRYPFEDLIASIVSWMQANQPDAMISTRSRQQAIKFNVANINGNQCDLTIELTLSERIKPIQQQDKLEFNSLTDRIILQESLEKYGY
ncbi:phage tail protein [Gilliamella apicola]|uniref:phage tail protein n=1 Tax=Gilliamella apicola TaxID=1196095 RepID=UPI0025EA9C64|nr:phage tail protein [uncultured Gilliamella sp.]